MYISEAEWREREGKQEQKEKAAVREGGKETMGEGWGWSPLRCWCGAGEVAGRRKQLGASLTPAHGPAWNPPWSWGDQDLGCREGELRAW